MKRPKPTSPGIRHLVKEDFSDLTKKRPEKSLVKILKKTSGRNNKGRITVRHKGGGAKRFYRMVDFKQTKIDMIGTVQAIEYDPNRTTFIVLIEYEDKTKAYRLAPQELKIGDKVIISEKAEVKIGNRMKIKNIPIGTEVYNIEILPSAGGKLVRSAGASAKVMGAEGKHVAVKMPSKELRKIHKECFASIGALSRQGHRYAKLGKAGRKRHKGIRPTVRGSAMSPVDHPHGGGEGRAGIGMPHPKTPWGKIAFGTKTRKRKRTNKFIIKRRK